MKSLSVNAQEFVPGGGGLMSPIANNRMQLPPPPPPPPLPPPHHHIAIPAYHDPSSPIVTFTNLSILPPGQMSGGPPAPSNIPYFNQYDLNAKLMELAANQQQQQQGQNQASSQQQYSFYSEIIPSPIVYTTAAPVIFSPAQFVHNHSSSPIAHFIAPPPPPPPQAPPPHVQPVLPHLTIGYQTAPGGSPMAQPLPPPPLQYHHHHHQQPQPQQQPTIIPHPQIVQNPYYQKPPKQQQTRQQQNFNNNTNRNNNNNKTNRMNKKTLGNNNANAAVPSNNKPTNLEDEKEWPSLEPNQPTTPYIADEAKFRKVVANVPFIKNAIEQHYLNEEKSKLSFKQALATTTTTQKAPLSQPQQTVVTESASGTKEKKRRRRSKSKKRDKSGDSEAETTEETMSNKNEPFDLGKEDFPGLDASDSSNKKSLTKATSGDEIDAGNKQAVTGSDALNKSANGKRLNAPIVIEFANMISALEKSQHTDLANSKYSPGRQAAANLSMSSQQSGGESANSNSKIERVGTVKTGAQGQQVLRRGKERENPKPKKKSTLKKIILREREEKKKTSAALAALNESSGALQVDITSNSPVNSMHLNELFASPREQQQPNQPSEEDTHKNEEETSGEKEPENDQDPDEDEDDDEDDDDDDDDTNTNTNTNNNEEVMSNQMSPISQNSPISGNGYAPSPYTALNVIANERSLISMDKLEQLVKQKVHSRKFREYCNQIVNRDIDEICTLLLQEIVRFQDRMYHKNPNKAKMRRRYVMGIREVTKHLKLKKLKCVILAPNCEKIESKGGLDDAINLIIQTSMEQNVPFVFALGRKGLGKVVNKLVPISVIGLFDFSGAEEYFKRLVELAENAKFAYQEMIEEYEREECENLINFASSSGTTSTIQVAAGANAAVDVASSAVEAIAKPAILQQPLITAHSHHNPGMVPQPRIPSHMGHSRTPSNGSTISIEPFYHHMNYHTHSRSASGNFNYGQTTTTTVSFSGVPPLTNSANPSASASGHVRSASGGGSIDLGKPWLPSHSRTPSNCSNISFISRLSEPISEVGGTSSANSQLASSGGGGGAFAAVQYYTEQVRQEMREMRESSSESLSVATTATTTTTTDRTGTESLQQMSSASMSSGDQEQTQVQKPNQIAEPAANTTTAISASLANLHLGCIDEIDGGNEADTEEAHNDKQQSNTHNEARSVENTDSKADETTSQ